MTRWQASLVANAKRKPGARVVLPAQGMSAEGENSRSEVEGEARQPGPKDAPNSPDHTPTQETGQ
jgi:hypothetical protein